MKDLSLENLIVAVIAAVAGLLSALASFLVLRSQRERDQPFATCEVSADAGRSGWHLLDLQAHNPSSTRWLVESLSVPRRVKGAAERAAMRDGFYGLEFDRDLVEPNATAKTIALYGTLEPAGSYGASCNPGPRDVCYIKVYLCSPDPARDIKVSMRLNLVSKDAVQRKKAIPIVRTLAATTSKAAD